MAGLTLAVTAVTEHGDPEISVLDQPDGSVFPCAPVEMIKSAALWQTPKQVAPHH